MISPNTPPGTPVVVTEEAGLVLFQVIPFVLWKVGERGILRKIVETPGRSCVKFGAFVDGLNHNFHGSEVSICLCSLSVADLPEELTSILTRAPKDVDVKEPEHV